MPRTLCEVFNEYGCTPIDVASELLAKNVTTRSVDDVKFKMVCGHIKECKIGTLLTKPKCADCKLFTQYGYNIEDKTLTCKKCNEISYHVPRTNLCRFVCIHCSDSKSLESILFRYIHKKVAGNSKRYISRYAHYPGKSKKPSTADAQIYFGDYSAFIEVDEVSHHYNIGLQTHKAKDEAAASVNKPLIRIYSGDVKKEVCLEMIWELINDIISKESFTQRTHEKPYLIISSPEAHKFFSKANFEYTVPAWEGNCFVTPDDFEAVKLEHTK